MLNGMSRVVVVSFLGLLFSLVCLSDGATPAKIELARKILMAQGTQQQLASLSPQIYAGLAEFRVKLAPDGFNLLMLATQRHFSGPQLYELYEATFIRQLTEDQLKLLGVWYETPLAKKFSEMEVAGGSPKALAAMKEYGEKQEKNPAQKTRARLIKDLIKMQRTNDVYVDIVANVSAGITAGALAIEQPEGQVDIKPMRRRIAELRIKIRPKLEKSTFLTFLYQFREANDAELIEYTRFMQTPTGRALTEASLLSLNDSLQKAAQDVGVDVARAKQSMKDGH